LALTSENELYGFGGGVYGECGYGDFNDTSKPKLIKFPNDMNNKDITQDIDGHDEEYVFEMYLKE
jgi:Regulator of chromosome condensation (RCC1) repeat